VDVTLLWPIRRRKMTQPNTHLLVHSFNIRYDSMLDWWDKSWGTRKEHVGRFIRGLIQDNSDTTAVYSVVGLQEALMNQLEDIQNYTDDDQMVLKDKKKGFLFFSTGREANNQGEHCSVLFHVNSESKQEALGDSMESGTFWLSRTPNTPSKGWDAMCYRIVTWVLFPVQIDGEEQDTKYVLYMNTHWDHWGSTAVMESAKLIKNFVKDKLSQCDKDIVGVFLSGDFNVKVNDKSFEELLKPVEFTMQNGKKSFRFYNSYDYCKEQNIPVVGNESTFTNWNIKESRVTRIDHILFASTNENYTVTPTKYECFEGLVTVPNKDNQSKKTLFLSDHRPIMTSFVIRKSQPLASE